MWKSDDIKYNSLLEKQFDETNIGTEPRDR